MTPPLSIEAVLKRLNIDAKKAGREWAARCPSPAHEDKTSSWRIVDQPGHERHGLHVCMSCGFGGTLLDLVMELNGLSYREARDWLGGDATTHAPVAEHVLVEFTGRRKAAFHYPPGVREAPFEKWPSAPREYVLKRRITPRQVSRWGFAYAVDGRLGGRIVLPMRDQAGVMQNYTARTYRADVAKRYLQPAGIENPGHVVYGECFWPAPIDRHEVYVTEGEFNALAIERVLGEGVALAAVSGSQLRPLNAAHLSTFSRLYVLSDPDAAGDKLFSFLETGLGCHCELVRVRLPEGSDADSVPPEVLRTHLEGAAHG